MLKFTEQPKHRDDFKKTVLSWKGISSLEGDFVLFWMKQRLWFNLQRDGAVNGLSNVKETFTKKIQLKISVICTKV